MRIRIRASHPLLRIVPRGDRLAWRHPPSTPHVSTVAGTAADAPWPSGRGLPSEEARSLGLAVVGWAVVGWAVVGWAVVGWAST